MWRSPARLLPQNVSSVDVLKSGERLLVQRSRSEAMSGMLWLDEKVLERRYACRKLCLPRSGAHASPVMLPDLSPVVFHLPSDDGLRRRSWQRWHTAGEVRHVQPSSVCLSACTSGHFGGG